MANRFASDQIMKKYHFKSIVPLTISFFMFMVLLQCLTYKHTYRNMAGDGSTNPHPFQVNIKNHTGSLLDKGKAALHFKAVGDNVLRMKGKTKNASY
jgi:hypothetical protein